MRTGAIRIAGRPLGARCAPFIIAEMSGNHNHSLERALDIVDAAYRAGAHALKLQTYTADTLTLDVKSDDFTISEAPSPWHGRTLHDLYQEASTPWEWHEPIMERCREHGLICFSTPFDSTSLEFLEALDVPAYKIASFENVDLPLIRIVAATGKPVIMSTGMASAAELEEAVAAVREGGCSELVLLKCTSSYPATPAGSNLRTIPDMRDRFGCEVGLSDHTLGIGVAVAAVALGATVIEKHFTLRRADGGVDSAFSMEPEEMRALVEETEKAWQALGEVEYGPTEQERGSVRFRRSLYVAEDIRAGEEFTEKNLRSVRPGYGLPPKHYEEILGRHAARDLSKGTAMAWDMVDK